MVMMIFASALGGVGGVDNHDVDNDDDVHKTARTQYFKENRAFVRRITPLTSPQSLGSGQMSVVRLRSRHNKTTNTTTTTTTTTTSKTRNENTPGCDVRGRGAGLPRCVLDPTPFARPPVGGVGSPLCPKPNDGQHCRPEWHRGSARYTHVQ
eukprot:2610506-Rhodomonas_salina.5